MIQQLQPDQVSLFWDKIKEAILGAYNIPRDRQQDFILNYLIDLSCGNSQCWLGYELIEDGKKNVCSIMTTRVVDDNIFGMRMLLIDTLYGFRFISDKMMDEFAIGLEKFAKASGCRVGSAATNDPRTKELLLRYGFEEHYTTYRRFVN